MDDLREKVIKGLECCGGLSSVYECPYTGSEGCDNCKGNIHVDALSLLKAQKPVWISVKDRMPEEYGNYLAVVDGEVAECTYSGPFIKGIITGWSTCDADGIKWLRDEHVTHWMPLPEPPKEET